MRTRRERASTGPTWSWPPGLFGVVYGFSNAETDSWTAPVTIFALAASAVLLSLFVVIERRAAHPLLPLHIVRDRGRGGAYASIALAGSGVFGVFLFLTFYIQQTLGFSALKTGVAAFLPMTAMIVVTATTVQTRLLPRLGARKLIAAGMMLGLAAMLVFTRLEPGSSYATHVLPGLLLIGAPRAPGSTRAQRRSHGRASGAGAGSRAGGLSPATSGRRGVTWPRGRRRQVTSVSAPANTNAAAHRWSEFTHALRSTRTPSFS